ncbi:hypothetical protein DID88_002581 [Monilinia fructigena]|uniref:Uncharacterized protein n=1 Tax=Monilinia fructigena TaxID=38457 RepID=A0A395IP62_9HELO|nr:hypothetical protein DID88_002581 [Monilinia fructigena]
MSSSPKQEQYILKMGRSNDNSGQYDFVWLKGTHWGSMNMFLRSYGLKIQNDDDYSAGKKVLAAIRQTHEEEKAFRSPKSNGTQSISQKHQENGAINCIANGYGSCGATQDGDKFAVEIGDVRIESRPKDEKPVLYTDTLQRNRNTPGPSVSAQDRKGKPETGISSEYDIQELYDGSIKASSNVQHGSDDKGKSDRGTSEGDDTAESLSNFKPWKGKSASFVSEKEEDYIVSIPSTKPWKGKSASCASEEKEEDNLEPMPSTKPWKGKSVRWKSDGDEIIETTSNTKNWKKPAVEKWTRKWSNQIDELRKSCGATGSKYEENEENEEGNPEDGGIGLDEMMRNLELEYESNDEDEEYYKHDENEDDTLTLGVSLGNLSPETLPSSSSEQMTSIESLESK